MDEQTLALLAQLKDIHAPANPSWWPPAPGWWLLAILLIFLVYQIVMFFFAKRYSIKHQQFALKKIERIEGQLHQHPASWGHHQISSLMKRVAIEAFPERGVAALTSDNWTAFLAQTAPTNSTFDAASLGQSQQAGYQNQPQKVSAEIFEDCKAWIQANYLPIIKRATKHD